MLQMVPPHPVRSAAITVVPDPMNGLDDALPARAVLDGVRDQGDRFDGRMQCMASRMKSPEAPSTQEALAGLVERVTLHNEENGFCVLRTKAR